MENTDGKRLNCYVTLIVRDCYLLQFCDTTTGHVSFTAVGEIIVTNTNHKNVLMDNATGQIILCGEKIPGI